MAVVSFGYKMAWLAVRSVRPDDVVEALGIEEARPSSWADGIEAVYSSDSLLEHPVFVTPDLNGWVLVASPAYFEEASDADPERLVRFVTGAAQLLETEVQFFATHRAVEGHAWARADPQGLGRAYFYLGETGECLIDMGDRTSFEETLTCLAPDDSDAPDEATVMSVANAWSLDPTGLEDGFAEVGDGLLGLLKLPQGLPVRHDGTSPRREDAEPGVATAALLDQVHALDARYEGLERWRVWEVPLAAVLVLIPVAMLGLSYRDPLGFLIYALLAFGPIFKVIMRRRLRAAMLREREQIFAQHEAILDLAAAYRDAQDEDDQRWMDS